MKFKISLIFVIFLALSFSNQLFAEKEKRDVATFSEVALRIDAKIYLVQGSRQSVEVVAKASTLEELITEVKGRSLVVRFPNKTLFKNSFKPGKIEIYVTVPDIDGLSVSGSGDILAGSIESRIIDLAVSGSGNIVLDNLESKRVTASVSGSGNIEIKKGGVADELTVAISGSGNVKAEEFEATDVVVRTSGSGSCYITTNGSIKARIAGSGDVYYRGNPSIDSSVAGSGKVRKI